MYSFWGDVLFVMFPANETLNPLAVVCLEFLGNFLFFHSLHILFQISWACTGFAGWALYNSYAWTRSKVISQLQKATLVALLNDKKIKAQNSVWKEKGQQVQYGWMKCLEEALAEKRCYKSKITDNPSLAQGLQSDRKWIPKDEIRGPGGQRSSLIPLLNLRLKQGSSKSIREKGIIRMENDRHLLEQVIALGCTLGEWNKHSQR